MPNIFLSLRTTMHRIDNSCPPSFRQLQSLLGTCRSRGDDDVTATFYLSGLCDEQGDYVTQKVGLGEMQLRVQGKSSVSPPGRCRKR